MHTLEQSLAPGWLLFRAEFNRVSPFLLSLSGCWWYHGKLLQGYPPLSGPSSPATAWVGPALAWSQITNLILTSTGGNLEGSCTRRCTSFGICNCIQCFIYRIDKVGYYLILQSPKPQTREMFGLQYTKTIPVGYLKVKYDFVTIATGQIPRWKEKAVPSTMNYDCRPHGTPE